MALKLFKTSNGQTFDWVSVGTPMMNANTTLFAVNDRLVILMFQGVVEVATQDPLSEEDWTEFAIDYPAEIYQAVSHIPVNVTKVFAHSELTPELTPVTTFLIESSYGEEPTPTVVKVHRNRTNSHRGRG